MDASVLFLASTSTIRLSWGPILQSQPLDVSLELFITWIDEVEGIPVKVLVSREGDMGKGEWELLRKVFGG